MSNYKEIEIVVDNNSWGSKSAPLEIKKLSGFRSANIDLSLLHTALWTRPPKYTGFDLSDCWAWLRYQRAFAGISDLMFRSEWNDIDPHQKTVSSDELGVGFTTQLFVEELDFLAYGDTKYILEILDPYGSWIAKKSKNGQNKLPDYIAIDSKLRLNILECKGTQTSLSSLSKAIQGGRTQKTNINPNGGVKINHSLVSGLYIPQWNKPSKATIQISDPIWEDLMLFLEKSNFQDLSVTITQIVMAKQFALMGFYSMANAIMNISIKHHGSRKILNVSDRDFEFLRSGDYLVFSLDMPLPPHEIFVEDIRAKTRRVNFRISYPFENFRNLLESTDVFESFDVITRGLEGKKWKQSETDTTVVLISPFGFELSLQYLY
ncbi:MAG: hypothetical protein J0M11_21770 [Anaerolineae bacterium]|nr:hypothetical protein [Anaerolineae bacterium]